MILPEKIKNQKVLKLISIFIPFSIILNYFYIIINYSINFPFLDDFHAILDFLNKFILHPELHERIKELFSQHNEHRILFVKVIVLIQYYLLDQLNFKLFIIIGNSSLVLTLIFLYKSFIFKHKVHILSFMPVSIILFNQRYWETSFWAMSSIQNLWVICLALMSLYFLFKASPHSIYFSILFAWIAALTSANGMITYFAGTLVLIIRKEFLIKKKILWVLSGIIVIVIYFYSYKKPSYHPEIIKPLLENPIGFLGYVFAFLGDLFTDNLKYAVCIGICLVLFIIFITIKKYYKENPVIYSLIIFILITSVLAALTRFGFGIGQALSPRYTIYSTLLVICCYLAFVTMMYRKINIFLLMIFTALAFIFNIKTQTKYLPKKIAEKNEFDINYALVTNGKFSNFNFGWYENKKNIPKKILKTSDSLGYFKYKYIEDSVLINRISTIKNKETKFYFDKIEQIKGAKSILLTGWSLIKKTNSDNIISLICLKDYHGKPIKFLLCTKVLRKDVTEYFKGDETSYDFSGFNTILDISSLNSGKYYLYIILVDKHYKYKVEINTNLSVPLK